MYVDVLCCVVLSPSCQCLGSFQPSDSLSYPLGYLTMERFEAHWPQGSASKDDAQIPPRLSVLYSRSPSEPFPHESVDDVDPISSFTHQDSPIPAYHLPDPNRLFGHPVQPQHTSYPHVQPSQGSPPYQQFHQDPLWAPQYPIPNLPSHSPFHLNVSLHAMQPPRGTPTSTRLFDSQNTFPRAAYQRPSIPQNFMNEPTVHRAVQVSPQTAPRVTLLDSRQSSARQPSFVSFPINSMSRNLIYF